MEHPEGKLLLFPSHIFGSRVLAKTYEPRVPQVKLCINQFRGATLALVPALLILVAGSPIRARQLLRPAVLG
jgi:hypothetical protein